MPTIKKNKPKPSQRRKGRQKLYQLKQWRDLSEYYRMMHPLCEVCLEQGKTTPCVHVHHINSPFDYGLSYFERLARLLDIENLIAVCQECHTELHQKKVQKNVIDGGTF